MPETTGASGRGGTLRRVHLMVRSNWISSAGAALATFALIAAATAWGLQSTEIWTGPYVGIVTFALLPALFLLGLLLVPIGLLLYRRQLRARMERIADKPLYLARAVVVLTLVNFAGVGTLGYTGVDYMSSVQFCGTACHEAMEPEYRVYLSSPHARVDCVACHVGPGGTWFVKSKINGAKQLLHYLQDSYQKPIPTPVHMMRPAEETCLNCHWPQKYLGTKLVVRPHFRDNADVSAYVNVVILRRGGERDDGEAVGIHWHSHPEVEVEFVATDDRREEIAWIRSRDRDGSERIFTAEGVDPENPPEGERRVMDCHDCHNRAAHRFDLPEEAVDRAIAAGLISRRLPSIRKIAVETLRAEHTRDGAQDSIRRAMQAAYNSDGILDEDTRPLLEPAIERLTEIWMRNVYPDLNLGWNTYPDLKGHFGCFRCHDGEHKTAEGTEIPSACDVCHIVLSDEETDPDIVHALGLGNGRR